jgi:predicted permease
VRLAIGASRGRLVRQLVAESLVLSAAGAALGWALAQGLSRFLVTFLGAGPGEVFVDLQADWRVFAFTAGLAILTCLLFGLAPAIRATETEPAAAMKAGGRGMTDSRERFAVRRVLVVAQVALSLVLVVGALLFVRSLRNLMTLDAGFRQDNLLAASFDLRRAGVSGDRILGVTKELLARLAAVPGIKGAAQAMIVPVSGSGWNDNILIKGVRAKTISNFNAISAGYFKTMGTPMLEGRDIDAHDMPGSPKVAIVNESFAKQYFDGADPIGQTFQVEETPVEAAPLYQVVGLVKDTKYSDLREPFGPIAYVAAAQQPLDLFPRVLLRTAAAPEAITAAVTSAALEINSGVTIQYQTMTEAVQQSLLRERLMATLSGFFGALAAVLATIGLYGIMSYMVERRRNEIGIRMALGADRRDVVSMVMREAATLLAAGLIVGSVLALAAGQMARTLLFGVTPGDPSTLILAASGLAAIAIVASFLPARRAAGVEPTVALRDE